MISFQRILALINHYDAILTGTLTPTNVFQIFLTYLVPYAVATYGSAGHAKHIELEELREIENFEEQELEEVNNREYLKTLDIKCVLKRIV